jgi:bacterioferritin (cytochrome b1)
MAINHSAVAGVLDDAQTPPGDINQSVEQLNSLLRGEISAAETYRMAIDKFSQSSRSSDVGLLQGIQEEHTRAAQTLRDRIRELDGEPSDASGAWGAWAKLVQGLADMVGDTSSLKALKEGEEHGLKDYEAAIDRVDPTSRQLIQNQFVASQQRHIGVLDQLIGMSTKM